jgi:hypothetical protein
MKSFFSSLGSTPAAVAPAVAAAPAPAAAPAAAVAPAPAPAPAAAPAPALRPYKQENIKAKKSIFSIFTKKDDTFIYGTTNNDGNTIPNGELNLADKNIKIGNDFESQNIKVKIQSVNPKIQAFLEKKVYFADNGALVDLWEFFDDFEGDDHFYQFKPDYTGTGKDATGKENLKFNSTVNIIKANELDFVGHSIDDTLSQIIEKATTKIFKKEDGTIGSVSRPVVYCKDCSYENYRKLFVEQHFILYNKLQNMYSDKMVDKANKDKDLSIAQVFKYSIIRPSLKLVYDILYKENLAGKSIEEVNQGFIDEIYGLIEKLTQEEIKDCLENSGEGKEYIKNILHAIYIKKSPSTEDKFSGHSNFLNLKIDWSFFETYTNLTDKSQLMLMIKELLENKQKIFKILYPTTTGGKKRKSIKRKQTRSAKKSNRRKTKKPKRKN